MDKKLSGHAPATRQRLAARERAVSSRETCVRARERTTGEHELAVAERELVVRLEEEAHRARSEAHEARTERERLVEQMQQANEQLVLATVRADELAERALSGEQAKDEFLAMLGHELRNPLAPILTAVDLMEMREPDACPRERAVIKRQVRHMVRLVEDLLDISKITGGKVDLHCEPLELSEVTGRAIEMVSPLLDAKAHELVVDVPTEGLVVDADPARLAQVVANLLTNAAKYTPEGGRIVVAGMRRGERIALCVQDNGIGISKEMLPHIFDMFAQERQALDRAQGGLGLGLAIVKSIVSLHHGTVTARSEGHARGSEFVVELPAFREENVPARAEGEPMKVASSMPALRILVVDDNQDTADLTADVLSHLGHDVRVAYDGPSAIAAVADFVPDAALLDIGLPGMDGYELAQRLRARLGDAVRFVAMSGYGQRDDRQRSQEAGFSNHLVKPVNVESLQAALMSPR